MTFNLLKTLLVGAAISLPIGLGVSASLAQTAAAPAAAGNLRAGSARVEITPQAADLPAPAFKTITDQLFVRALVLDNGSTRSAIVVGDLPTIGPKELLDLQRDIAAEIKAPVGNVVMAVTHNHSMVRIDHTVEGILLPGSPKITDQVMAATLQAVKQALTRMQPARAGYAQGETKVIGRRPQQAVVAFNPNEQGPPDTSLGVFKVETLSGEPIAFLINSGLEPVMIAPLSGEVSADVAGVTERYIENRYGDKPVAMYTVSSISNAYYSSRRQGSIPAAADPHVLMNAVGAILGEDAMMVAAQIKPSSDLRIGGALTTLQCPGKVTTPLNTAAQCSDAPGSKLPACKFTDHDAPPVKLQVGVLRLGDLTIAQSDANITQPVWQRLKAKAPPRTQLVASVYGPMKYVVEGAAYPSNSYVATATTAKPGCAADGFVNTVSDMLQKAR